MNSNLNRGEWKKLENRWVKNLPEAKTVYVKIEPLYEGTSLRPESFYITSSIDGETLLEHTFKNAPGGK